MGFKASCSVAQGITDVATSRAGLPASRRLLPDREVPLDFPVWGSI